MKAKRQRKIKEIIKNNDISTQEELANALKKAGFNVTQATVSRDIKELRLVKIARKDNVYVYGLPKQQAIVHSEDRLRLMMQEFVQDINFSENLIVLKTYPGNAHGVASLLDSSNWEGIIGTLAGDDTILLIIKPREKVEDILNKLKSLMK
ncbi:MAG: arginine repressor [Clostridia bacterium]|nr:arginine repressor [Clostridia bacterium]